MGFEQTLALDYLLKVLRPRAYAKTLGDRWPRRMAKAMVLAGLARGGSPDGGAPLREIWPSHSPISRARLRPRRPHPPALRFRRATA